MSDIVDEKTQPNPPKLSTASLLLRLGVIGVIIGGAAGLFAYSGGWLSPRELTPARFADTFEKLNGVHPGFRRNHAKGLCATGYFEANGNAVSLSKAGIFAAGRVPVLARFSLSGGNPDAADAPDTVRGLGVRFKLSDGEEWRTAMVNLPVFPAKTPESFHELLLATAPDPATGKPDMAKIKAYAEAHPEFLKFRELAGSHPMSSGFDNTAFNSLTAFRFINAAGETSWVRWSMVPVQPFRPIVAPTGITNKNWLFDNLIAAVHRQPLQWHLIISVAQPGDAVDDATVPWPADRKQIDAGTLTLDNVESDDTGAARDINFDPLILPDGIAASDDPILQARSGVYSKSFTRRESETKTASAISAQEAAR